MEFIKEFSNLSLGMGALAALVVVIIKQLELVRNMNETINQNSKVMESLRSSVDANTRATHEMADCFRTTKFIKPTP